MDLAFTTLDVFTTQRLQGNPLAVVRVPASLRERLTQPIKQKIAQEFNLSETVFLHDDTSKSGTEARDVDIFTIERELPFAGHPTIGTAMFVRHHLDNNSGGGGDEVEGGGGGGGGGGEAIRTLITKAGLIGIEPLNSSGIRAQIPHNVHLHAKTLRQVTGSVPEGGGGGGLHPNPEIREAELDAPVFSIVKGMTFVLVHLSSLDLLAEVRPLRLDFDAIAEELLDEGWREGLVCRYYYVDVVSEDADADDGGDIRFLRTRMVELGFEDPATGSAATALGAYLTLTEERKGKLFKITQGVEMGRRSDISVETTTAKRAKATVVGSAESGKVVLENVYLGGTAVVVMRGTLSVDV